MKLRGKLSNYHASIAEAYLLDGFDEEKEDSSSDEPQHLKVPSVKKPNKKKQQATSPSLNDKDDNDDDEDEDEEDEEEDNAIGGDGSNAESGEEMTDTTTNKLISELRSTIMDLQQQLAESRRYNMQLDMAHQTSVRESKKLKNELSKHVSNNVHDLKQKSDPATLSNHLRVIADHDDDNNNNNDNYDNNNNDNYNNNNDDDDDDDDDDEDDNQGIVDVDVAHSDNDEPFPSNPNDVLYLYMISHK
ncbi:hypothetical protein RFI_21951 [Reticulomyxa filosa]|uniref:Uncharacterized protein n=1 Tax=Reticulomyxa filosa TaxID=46433 RepID=X6MN64_RETFI|nr:hypothetical protein RFI_21951 [Reticulomyxa filosa]|eukprot:ETO15413.1 hypothetical protein RFI_21951 [Reticulomyxa filosa]